MIRFPFPTIIAERGMYFSRLESRFQNYNADVQEEMKRSLPKIKVLNPALHELISSLHERTFLSTPTTEIRDFELYDAMRGKLIEYIKLKHAHTDQKFLEQLDIWTQSLSQAKDEDEAREFLNASDQIQDLLWLASFVSTKGLPEEETQLSQAIQKIVLLLPDFLKVPSIDADLGDYINNLLKNISSLYVSGQYSNTLDEIEKLKQLIFSGSFTN
jgi:hypothetical protein